MEIRCLQQRPDIAAFKYEAEPSVTVILHENKQTTGGIFLVQLT